MSTRSMARKENLGSYYRRILSLSTRYGLPMFFILMCVGFGIGSKAFFSAGNVSGIIHQTIMLALASYGMTMVFMVKGIDMSLGGIAGIGAIATCLLMVTYKVPALPAILCGLTASTTIGLLNGLAIAYAGISPFVVTLSTMFAISGIQFIMSHGGKNFFMGIPEGFLWLSSGYILGIPVPIIILLLVGGSLYIMANHTATGRYVFATGANLSASRYSGIRIRRYTLLAYLISGTVAGLAGMMLAARQALANVAIGAGFLMDSFVTTYFGIVIAGRPSILGTTFGALFLTSLISGLSVLGVSPATLHIAKGLLLLGAIVAGRLQTLSNQ